MLRTIVEWARRHFGRPFLSVADGREFMRYRGGAIKATWLLLPEAGDALEKEGALLRQKYRKDREALIRGQRIELNRLTAMQMSALHALEDRQRRLVSELLMEYLDNVRATPPVKLTPAIEAGTAR